MTEPLTLCILVPSATTTMDMHQPVAIVFQPVGVGYAYNDVPGWQTLVQWNDI